MTTREYYSKAQIDSVFRKEEMETNRYYRKVTLVFSVGISVLCLCSVAYFAIAEGRWAGSGRDIGQMTLAWWLFEMAHTRVATLEAIPASA